MDSAIAPDCHSTSAERVDPPFDLVAMVSCDLTNYANVLLTSPAGPGPGAVTSGGQKSGPEGSRIRMFGTGTAVCQLSNVLTSKTSVVPASEPRTQRLSVPQSHTGPAPSLCRLGRHFKIAIMSL